MDDPGPGPEPDAVRAWREAGRSIEIGGRAIFVVDTGSPAGPTGAATPAVLLLHGFPGSTFDWRGVIPRLARRARVVAFDLLGYGLSAKPPEARCSLLEQADLAEAVAERLGLERCLLLAHDLGDTVAAELLARSTASRLGFGVDGAVLTNGSIFIDLAVLSPGQLALLAMPDEPLPAPLPLEGFRAGLAATFGEEHPPGEGELDAMTWLVARAGGDRLLPRLIRYIEERRANQERFTAGLVEFPGPLLLLWGRRDPIAVVAMVERLRELRPATDVLVWDDVGHWPSIEVPDRLAAAVLARIA